jgi:hypothetical protein
MGLLACGNLDREINNPDDEIIMADNYCDFILYQNPCSLALNNDDQKEILKNCNFSAVVPELVTRTQNGILIMNTDKNLIIKELSETKRSKSTLSSKTPVLIRSNYPINIHSNELELTIKPLKKTVEFKVIYSRYKDDFIDGIVASALKHDILSEMNYLDYALIILALVLILTTPIVCCLCIRCIKGSEIYEKVKNSRARTIIKMVDTGRKNYKENKRMLKKGLGIVSNPV